MNSYQMNKYIINPILHVIMIIVVMDLLPGCATWLKTSNTAQISNSEINGTYLPKDLESSKKLCVFIKEQAIMNIIKETEADLKILSDLHNLDVKIKFEKEIFSLAFPTNKKYTPSTTKSDENITTSEQSYQQARVVIEKGYSDKMHKIVDCSCDEVLNGALNKYVVVLNSK